MRKEVQPGLQGSYEELFHEVGVPRFLLPLKCGDERLREKLRVGKLQRAIGVIYRPETERLSHYFSARLSEQFDAVIHIDETRAVESLDRPQVVKESEEGVPETFPSGQ